MQIVTHNEAETYEFAMQFAKTLKAGQTVALIGDLGAGKTVFAKGVAKGLGINEPVLSPTFTIVHEYPRLNHFDVYRLSGVDELYEIGFEEYLDGSNITLIEWANLVEDALPQGYIKVNIKTLEDGKRRITVT